MAFYLLHNYMDFIYFLSMLITPISKFMMNLKNNRVYERLATTSASGFKIMFTQFISIALIESVVYSLTLYGVNKAFNIGLINIFHILTFMFLFASINVAIAMLITRVVKNEEMGPSIGIIFAMAQFILVLSSVLPVADSSVIALTNVLNKFNPMYWTLFGIKNSQLFPNVIMLVLMIGVFVTAGSYKFMNMANE